MSSQSTPLKVLVVGLGNMGLSHALAYHAQPEYNIVALVNRSPVTLPTELGAYPLYQDYNQALSEHQYDVICISTYTETHAEYAIAALEHGAHVFLEKPLASSVADAKRVIDTAAARNKKLVVGYILRHHPSWQCLIAEARKLGPPYVFRLNLNQQSSGSTWGVHKKLLNSVSPIVDCGVHYVDVMCQITDAKPVSVNGMGVRLANDIADSMYNYGQFQVRFDDGSVGWYEAGWGPMISETAFFVKDIISPNGAVSIELAKDAKSDSIDAHTQTSSIRVHKADLDSEGGFKHKDELLSMQGEPGHQALCDAQQRFLQQAITENWDLTRHWRDAVLSLQICLCADQSIREQRVIDLTTT